MPVEEVIAKAYELGIELRLDGRYVKAVLPDRADPRVAEVLARLKASRGEVVRHLRERDLDPYQEAAERAAKARPPAMPKGVKLVAWRLKRPPVAISECSVVIDPESFAVATLRELECALREEDWLAGNWGVRGLLERLEQVGARVELTGASAEEA